VQQERIPQRARQTSLALFVTLVLVLIVHLAIGLSDVLLFGLVGGLVGSLVVVGLDLLRNAERAVDAAMPRRTETNDAGEMRR
jgi:hypothetical protein